MSLALDRKAFDTILMEGHARPGGAMLAKPAGEWGMPPEVLASLTGYGPDPGKNIAEAQAIMQKLATATPSRCRSRSRPAICRPIATPRSSWPTSLLEDLHIGRAGYPGYAALVRKVAAQGLHHRSQRHRRHVDDPDGNLIENYSCTRTQLHPVLQRRSRQAAVSAVARA